MKTVKLAENLYWTGVLDPDLRIFDIIMRADFGTTYNSFILDGGKTALFETAKDKFNDEYIAAVESVKPFSEIHYIILNHTEPDHSGSVERILELNPEIILVGTQTAITFLTHIVNKPFKSLVVKDGDTLSLGSKTLEFLAIPNLHWPDTMLTYAREDGWLFTCDFLGAHYSFDGVLRSKLPAEKLADYQLAVKQYYDNIMSPFTSPFVTNALKKLEGKTINKVLTGHGPVLDTEIEYVIKKYKEWSAPKADGGKKTVVIPYVSAYGYTKELAGIIAEGIKASGDIEVKSFDMIENDLDAVVGEITRADAVLFGTPTILGDALKPIWDIVVSLNPIIHRGKIASAFGSYGWSGEGVGNLTERLKQLKFKVTDGFKVRFKANEEQRGQAYEFGKSFGTAVLGK